MESIYKSPVAKSIPFDPTGSELTATDTNTAIIQSLDTAVAKPRFSIVTTFNGTVSNNQWLGYTNLIPGDQAPIRIPVDSILKEITFSFNGTSIDGVFDLYKNGLTGGDIILSIPFTNVNNFKVSTGLSNTLLISDYIVGRWVDTGSNPSDMAITYFIQVQ